MGHHKSRFKWTFKRSVIYTPKKKKKNKKSSNKLTSHPKQLGKNDKQNPILIEKKEIIKIKAEINAIEMRKKLLNAER